MSATDRTPAPVDLVSELRLRLAEADRVIRRQRAEIEALRGRPTFAKAPQPLDPTLAGIRREDWP